MKKQIIHILWKDNFEIKRFIRLHEETKESGGRNCLNS